MGDSEQYDLVAMYLVAYEQKAFVLYEALEQSLQLIFETVFP